MSTPFTSFATLLDFSKWETAVQAFFCDATQGGGLFVAPPDNSNVSRELWQPEADKTAFFTGRQSQVFQKQRPRVDMGTINYSLVPSAKVVDDNGRHRPRAWSCPIDLFVITAADYDLHAAMLAKVRAIAENMVPELENHATTGLNAFLDVHELCNLEDAGGPIFGGTLESDAGYFLTPLKYNAIFAVRASAWPGTNATT